MGLIPFSPSPLLSRFLPSPFLLVNIGDKTFIIWKRFVRIEKSAFPRRRLIHLI